MNMKDSIINYCKNIGLDTIGFTICREYRELVPLYELRKNKGLENSFEENDIEKRVNPFFHFPEGKSIVSIAFPYYFDVDYQYGKGFSIYTLGEDYHKVVMEYLNNICNFIIGLGGKAMAFSDSNPLPERYIAFLSGIGFIGKNNMLYTEKYGSYVFLGEIITDLKLTDENKEPPEVLLERLMKYEACGQCDLCLKTCPTKSININERNANICLSYITQKKDIEDKWFTLMGDRLFGCDSCQLCCPKNENIQFSCIDALQPKEYMLKYDINELIKIDKKSFLEKYKITSCGWRGKNILQRNALIYAYNNEIDTGKVEKINSPYIADYHNRLSHKKKL